MFWRFGSLGRSDVELAACQFVNFLFEFGHFLGKLAGHARQSLAIHLDAVALHPGENGREGALQRFVDGGHFLAVQLRFEGQPEAQGDVGILGGVFHGLGHRHAVKGDGRFAAAQQGLDGDRRVAEIAFGKRVHAMPVNARVQRVGHQHRVVERRDGDVVTGENLGVVFHVLPDLEDRIILEHRLERGQHIVGRQLPFGQRIGAEQVVGRPVAMRERDVTGLPRIDRQGNAHQIGLHFVERGGFGVHRHVATGADTVDPHVQRLHRRDVFVSVGVDGGPFGGFLDRVGACGVGIGDHRGLDPEGVGNALGKGAEFHLGQERQQGVGVGLAQFQIVEGEIERGVAIELHQFLGQFDLLALVDQGLAALGLFDLFGPVEQFLEAAELVDQQRGGLDADARRARHVIDAVAREGLHVDHAIRPDAEFFLDAFNVDAAVFHGIQHFDAAADQLHQVLVG